LIGLYAVVSYQVARRTREIGIRVALGAARQQVLGMVLKNSAVMAVTGVCIGTVLNLAASQMLSRGILGALVMRLNPASFVLLVLALLATTLLAAGIPARNASRIDPQKALRQE